MLNRLTLRLRLLCRHYSGDRNGNMTVMMAILLFMVMIVSGAGLDTARIVSGKQKTVDALDAATLFAASRSDEDDFAEEAQSFFTDSLIDSPFSSKTVSFQKTDNMIIGTAETTLPLAFGAFLGKETSKLVARSVVTLPGGDTPCMTALSTNATPGLTLNSGANIVAPNCEIHVHSTANPAMAVNSGVTLNVAKTCVAGSNIVDNGGFSDSIDKNCTVANDPYAGEIPEPDFSSCDWNGNNFNGANISLTPGVYCGWYGFNNNNAHVDFAPGTYIIRNGGWNVNGGEWTGEGVTFYFADTSRIQFNSGVKADLKAPETGTYAGIFMAEREGLSPSHFTINDSRGFIFEGAVYLPSRNLTFNSGSNNELRKTDIYADRIMINGANLVMQPLNSNTAGISSSAVSTYISE